MKTFGQYLNLIKLMEDAGPPPGGAPPAGGPPGGAAPPMGGPPMGGPPMGGPPMGGPPGAPPGGPPGGGQAPMKLKSTNVWDVLEKYLSGGQPQKTDSA